MNAKIKWDVAVENFGEEWAEEQHAAGKVEASPDMKRYGEVYPYVKQAREALAEITAAMHSGGYTGRLRVQYVEDTE